MKISDNIANEMLILTA